MTGYRAVTFEDLPELKKAVARVKAAEFKSADVLPLLPEELRLQIEHRELGRALISRGLAIKIGYDAGAVIMRRRC